MPSVYFSLISTVRTRNALRKPTKGAVSISSFCLLCRPDSERLAYLQLSEQ
jgi:hypothetical protein